MVHAFRVKNCQLSNISFEIQCRLTFPFLKNCFSFLAFSWFLLVSRSCWANNFFVKFIYFFNDTKIFSVDYFVRNIRLLSIGYIGCYVIVQDLALLRFYFPGCSPQRNLDRTMTDGWKLSWLFWILQVSMAFLITCLHFILLKLLSEYEI